MARRPQHAGQHDLTTGPIASSLLAFALPTLASNVLQTLNGSVNAIWVGRFLGESALAATANANIIMFLMSSAVFGFGMAAAILVGQSFGRRDVDSARRAFGSAVGMVVVGSMIIATLGWIFAPNILHVLATPGAALAFALSYLRVIFIGLPASMLLVLLTGGLRGSGDSLTPFWFMGLTVLLDATLNPVFILGLGPFPAMGIAGSAMATLIANVVSVAAMLGYIYRRNLPIRLRGAEWQYLLPGRALATTIVAKGLPMGAQMVVVSVAGLTMIGLVNRLGVDTAAAYGISLQLWAYIQMPAVAIGAAVSAMVAQNIGAGRWDRVSRITTAGLLIGLAVTSTMVTFILLFDRPIMTLFLGSHSPALPIASHIQLIASWNFSLFAMTMTYFAATRANGAVMVPLLTLLVAFFPVRIGFAFIAKPWLQADALWWSFPVGSIAALGIAATYYYHGGWRRNVLKVAPTPLETDDGVEAVATDVGRQHPNG
ncbi:MATE family efflux transporter [Sphingobium sp. SCG-1]|uniref:MATE family efflux transporter n=1 Tax=Sphingobium sp. SCG-1 TaxID=2072936 RepID=UPI000CD68F2C|nr:MATE family efflux transporter [Sphingobium sp. SCG-1]AUW57792.1 MATE family efflux transporter [Sphingobium sp. SCG-1]